MRYINVVAALFFLIVSSIPIIDQEPVSGEPSRVTFSQFEITGNDELISMKELNNWSGSGTEEDPVMIKDLEINSMDGKFCIKISSVSLHFIIVNCTLREADFIPDPGWPGAGRGIELYGSSNGTIKANRINGNYYGILIDGCTSIRITGNWVNNNLWDGILTTGSSILIDNNSIQNNGGAGIGAYNVDDLRVENNIIRDCDPGFEVNACDRSLISGNSVSGVNLVFGVYLVTSTNFNFKDNEIDGAGIGMFLYGSDNLDISGNFIHDCTDPMYIEKIKNSTICGNFIYGNSEPFTITYQSSDKECIGLEIFNNTFSGNNGAELLFNPERIQAEDLGTTVKFYDPGSNIGNHWTDWISPDNDGDGIVDMGYDLIGGVNSDPYPLVSSSFPLVEAPENLDIEVREMDIYLDWDPAVANFDLEIVGFLVHRTVIGSSETITTSFTVTNSYYIETSVISGYTYFYQVQAFTYAGLGERSVIVNATFDDSPPLIRIIEPKDEKAYNSSDLTAMWEVTEEESRIRHTFLTLDDDTTQVYGISTPIQLDIPGYHSIEVIVENDIGLSSSDSVDFIYDPHPPVLSLLDPLPSYTNRKQFTVRWTMSDLITQISSVFYKLDGTGWQEIEKSSEITLQFEREGLHVLDIKVMDEAGNINTTSKEIIVDLERPEIEIVSPMIDERINSSTISVVVNAYDNGSGIELIQVTMDSGSSKDMDVSGSVLFNDIRDGRHQITVEAYDTAGNVNITTRDIVIDTAEPYVVNYLPMEDDVQVDSNIWITFSETVLPDTVSIDVTGVEGKVTVYGSQASFVPFSELDHAADYEVSVQAMDIAGNPLRPHSWTFTTTDVGSLTGKVIDAQGMPLPYILVRIEGYGSVKTDSGGRFNISYSMGQYELNITKIGYLFFNTTVEIRPGEETDMGLIQLEEIETDSGNDDPLFLAIAATILMFALLVFLFVLFFYKRYEKKHTISEEDREQMLEILRHFDLSKKIDQVDAYETLEIEKDATKKDIKKAYRKLAAKYHPDRMMHVKDYNEDEAHEKMGEINAAKTILLDDEKRDLQDRILRITGRY